MFNFDKKLPGESPVAAMVRGENDELLMKYHNIELLETKEDQLAFYNDIDWKPTNKRNVLSQYEFGFLNDFSYASKKKKGKPVLG